jgi:DivIVA domain-containing protein
LTTARFEEQSVMTPDDLLTVTFPSSRLGRRGYEEEPVDEFLRAVHTEFLRLVNDRTALQQEVQRLRRRIAAEKTNGDSSKVLFGEADSHVHAVRILSTAQVTADRYVADAQAYSSRLTEEARIRRDKTLSEAQQYADMLLEDARARAREAAASVLTYNGAPTPAQAQPSDHERQSAQSELAYLRTYSDVYRAHLRAYTEGILRGIDDWERDEAAALAEATHGLPMSRAAAIDRNAYLQPLRHGD